MKPYPIEKGYYPNAFQVIVVKHPIEFILQEKMMRAKKLLLNSSEKIASISAETGFQDVNYFIRLFKKMEGVTPKQYRLNSLTKH